jgi:hypothetical protein
MPAEARRSKRVKKPVAEDLYVQDLVDGDGDESVGEPEEEIPPPRKRSKTKPTTKESSTKTVKRARGVKGKLSKLPDMPLDVLFEVRHNLQALMS